MVDTVEATASIEELDVNPNPSKSVSHLEQKQEHGFSAEQLRADIDFAQLKQTTQEKLKGQGIPAIVPKPNSKQVLMGQMEQILAEVFHYKTIQQYKDKITPEFIALFNEAEQAMLLELIELLDQYLVLQKEYVTELLQLLGYKDSDAFFADIATIPAVASAMEAKQAFYVAIPGIPTSYYSGLDLAAKVAKVIGPCRMFIIPHLMQRVQEEGPVDPNVPNKISMPYLDLVQQATAALADSDLPVELFARAHRLDAMELCYLQDKSQRHAEKRAAFARLKDYSSDHRFSTIFVKFFTNERIDGLSNIAKSLSDEWMLDTDMGEKVSAPKYITDIRFNATKASITINEAERQMSSRPIELPQDEAEILEEKKVKSRRTRRFTQRFTQMFSRSPVSAESEKPKILQSEPESVSSVALPEISLEEIKVTPVAAAADVNVPIVPELKRSASESQLGKVQPKSQLIRTSSLEKLSEKRAHKITDTAATKLKFAADSIAASVKNVFFTSKKSDISAPVSFIDYARTAWSVTERLKKNDGFKKLEFVYNRGDKKIRNKKPKGFREGDFVEICENDTSICTIVPQKLPKDTENEASGVGVTVHRHTDPDIRFAVRLMVEALAQQGEKRIYVTVSDRESPEGRELALKYVDVIFSEGAIPVLQDENGKVLSKEETKNELQRMVDAHDASAPSKIAKYRFLSERYESEIERIEAAEKADKLYLDEFAEFIESSEEGSSEFKKVITVVSKLADIAFVNHNLSRDYFIDYLLKYLQKGYPGRNPLYIDKARKELKILLDDRLADMSEVLPLEQIVQEAFNLAADKLDINLQISSGKLKVMSRQEQVEKDLLFLMFFENWLQNPQSSIPDEKGKIRMQDPDNGGKELSVVQIGIELTRIALIDNLLTKEALISKMLDCIRKLPGAQAVSVERLEEIKLEASNELKNWMDQKDSYGVEGISNKLFNFLHQALIDVKSTKELALQQGLPSIVQDRKLDPKQVLEQFKQRIAALYDKNKEIGSNRLFARALAAYTLFSGEMKHGNFELAREIMPEVSLIIEDAEQLLKADMPKRSSAERKEARERYQNILQKASPALKLDLENIDIHDNSLKSIARQMLAQDLTAQQEIDDILKETAAIEDRASDDFFASEVAVSVANTDENLDDADRAYLAFLDDSAFVEAFDKFVQKIDPAKKPVMQDPNTGEMLGVHKTLTRLTEITFVQNMTQEAFINRILAFGLAALVPAAQVALTDQKKEDLKEKLREKVRLHMDHPDGKRDDGLFVAHLIEFAQHALTPGHVAEDSKIYGVFAEKKSSCAASMRKEKEEAVSPQPATTMVH